jgi:hypothetical protein
LKTGRNDPCPCGSGKKYKHCCLPKGRGDDRTWPGAAQTIAGEIAQAAEEQNLEEVGVGPKQSVGDQAFAVINDTI